MELLQKTDDRNYPTEYLLSRIKGRRAFLIVDWNPLIFAADLFEYLSSQRYKDIVTDRSPEGIWRHLLREFRWVYLQMNRTLQDIFWPFFLYSELRTVFFCLRYKAASEDMKIEQMLVLSLLSKEVKQILGHSNDVLSAIKGIEDAFKSISERFEGLTNIFLKEGQRGVEQQLTDGYLEHAIETGLHPAIRDFFIRIIDARNIITLYKHIRWDMLTTPMFVRGGSIKEQFLMRVFDRKDVSEVGSIIRRLTGIETAYHDATAVENSLYKGMTQNLRRGSREPSGIGLVLDYLWRCSIEARNLDVVFYGKDIDRDTIMRELIR